MIDDDEISDEVFEMIKRIAGVYESLPPDSVGIVLSQKREDFGDEEKVDTSLLKEQVLVNVIDNLPKGSESSLVFVATHGLLEMLEENFDDLVTLGRKRIALLDLDTEEENHLDATILKFSDYKDKLH